MVRVAFFYLVLVLFYNHSYAQNEYYLTLRSDAVNLRQGPSLEHPVKLMYKKNFYLFWLLINLTILEKS